DPITFVLVTAPLTGEVVIDGATATYTAAATETTTETIEFAASDGLAQSKEVPVTVIVTVPNIVPVAFDQDVAADEGSQTSITLSGEDAEGAPLTYTVATQSERGELTGEAPDLTYTAFRQPTDGFQAADQFSFTVNDGKNDSLEAVVSITITDVNDAPVVVAASDVAVVEGSEDSSTLSAEDVDGDAFTFVVVAAPTYGDVVIDGGSAIYTAARQAIAGFALTDTFSIAAEDPTGLQSDPVVVAVAIEEINDPPTVSADPATVIEDGVVVIALTGQDPDSDPVTFLVSGQPTNGSVSITGSLATYTPDPNYDQDDEFTIVGTDGRDEGEPATVSVTVIPTGYPTGLKPSRVLETVRVLEGAEPLDIDLGGDNSLFTDVDEGQDPVISAASSDPAKVVADVSGSILTLAFLAPGSVVVTVSAETATGTAQFTVEVEDNLPPVVERLTPGFIQMGEAPVPFQIVARDPEGDALSYVIALQAETNPDAGDPEPEFVLDPVSGLLTAFLDIGISRIRNFNLTISVSDGVNDVGDPDLGLHGTLTTFLLKARRPNAAPGLAVQDVVSAPLGETASFDVVGSDENATDVLTISASSRDSNDPLDAAIRAFNTADETLDAGNFVKTFTFTATPDIAGQEFTIRWAVNDGELGATAETLLVAGEITNLAPSIDVATLLDTAEEGQAEDWVLPVTVTDPDGDALFIEVDASNEQITYDDAAGELRWTGIDFDSGGSYLITVRARDREDPADPEVKTSEVTITLVVFDVNREPVFDSVLSEVTVTKEDVVTVETTASDPDGEAVSLTVTRLPSWARILEQASGAQARLVVELAPTLASEDADFTIAAADAAGTRVEQTVTVTLDNPPNRDPIIEPLTSRNIEEGETLVVTIEASDPDGNELTFTADPLPDGAEFVNGVFTWTPSRGDSDMGEFAIVVTADDGFGGVASDTLTVRVQPGKNRPPHLSQLPILEIEEEGEGSINLAEYSSDPDGDPTTVALDTASLPGRLEMVDDVLTIRPVAGDAGTHPIHLRISDDRGKATARTLRVDVTPLDGIVAEGLLVSGAFVDPGVGAPSDVFEFQATVTNTTRRAPDPTVTLTLTLPSGDTRDIDMGGGKGNFANGVTYTADATLSPGDYSFVVTATSDGEVVTANGVGPTVEAAEVVVSDVTVSGAAGTLRISYMLDNPNAGIGADVAVEFSLNGTDWTIASGASGELAGLSTGQCEASWDTLFDLPDANGETVELRLTPTDGTPTLADGFQLDNVPPGAPQVDEIAAFVADPIIIVSGQSDSPGAAAVLQIDGLEATEGAVDANGTFRLSTPALEDGEHTISVFIREPAADGPASTQQSVVVDSVATIVTITSPETGATVSTRTPVLAATIDAGLSQADVAVGMRLNGRAIDASFSPAEGVVSFTPTELLVAGRVYLLSVTATKPSGAETVAASADDTAVPTGFGSSPSDGSIVADAQPSIEGVVQDAESGVDS
ncbi:MAG: Ig-like domain-containing protein, partial [Candidatus Poribacteria bacterium]